jgi:release factor glutamine methyltransferase
VSGALRDRILEARAALVRAGLSPDEAALDAEVLARDVLRWDRAQLLTRAHQAPPPEFDAAYAAAVGRRLMREPVAYITGRREFWGLEFEVSPAVLIPRPETELLVERALTLLDPAAPALVVDVGTGSGCLAVALAHERPRLRVLGIDRSADALAVAAANVARHGLTSRIVLVRGDLLTPIAGPVAMVVSNPPYVDPADAPGLQPEVAAHEPAGALFAGESGLAILRLLCETAGAVVAPGGRLVVEFGAGQDRQLREIAERSGWSIEISADLAGIPRAAVLQRRSA